MKRTVRVSFFSLLFFAALSGLAQDARHDKVLAKTVNMSGTVGPAGKSFVSDKGSRIWKVVNFDVLAATEGRHVTVKARANSQSNEIVISVVRLPEVRTTAKLDDAAFRK